MMLSDAYSPAMGSPRSRTSSSWARIIEVSTPLRRWVERTPTAVTPAMGMVRSPGRLSSSEKAPALPMMRSPSKAASVRSISATARQLATSSSSGWLPNAASTDRT